MSKPVLGLLAGLAVVAAVGRVKRGSFASEEYRLIQKGSKWGILAFPSNVAVLTGSKRAMQDRLRELRGLAGSRSRDEDKRFGTYTWGLTPKKVIEQAVAHHVGEAGTYPIEAHQGTDMLSHLLLANERAGIKPFRFSGGHGRVGLRYTSDELVKLLAALKKLDNDMGYEEDMDDSPGMVRSDILGTLGIEEV